ncbi:MAG: 16S rRNA (cytidine(1402)-2'-O)-methyltransferase [Clostridiales bacterium]|nr:16S rRNA (cytidine(1402)-2'-O)-methyltransferase [Clostridiales bacterium]
MAGKLYIVGTPIGNLGDMTFRAVETLKSVDFIAAEDTRVTRKLMTYFGISKPVVSYYEHNRTESGEKIVARILEGENCALVSDAGMPAISDPGSDLVKLCAEAGIETAVVPGASAVVSAVAISGMPASRFCFEGFLSTNRRSRREHLDAIRDEKRTMVFYEAPHKLRRTLSDLAETLGGDRKIAICRELTKLYEECIRTTLAEAERLYAENEPKGEFVLVIEGAQERAESKEDEAIERALSLVAEGAGASEAARQASREFGVSRNLIYREILASGTDEVR